MALRKLIGNEDSKAPCNIGKTENGDNFVYITVRTYVLQVISSIMSVELNSCKAD